MYGKKKARKALCSVRAKLSLNVVNFTFLLLKKKKKESPEYKYIYTKFLFFFLLLLFLFPCGSSDASFYPWLEKKCTRH